MRLVGGASDCAGRLEMKHQEEWKVVISDSWSLKETAIICRWLDCGSPVSAVKREDSSEQPAWYIKHSCVQSQSTVRECVTTRDYTYYEILEITCLGNIINNIVLQCKKLAYVNYEVLNCPLWL